MVVEEQRDGEARPGRSARPQHAARAAPGSGRRAPSGRRRRRGGRACRETEPKRPSIAHGRGGVPGQAVVSSLAVARLGVRGSALAVGGQLDLAAARRRLLGVLSSSSSSSRRPLVSVLKMRSAWPRAAGELGQLGGTEHEHHDRQDHQPLRALRHADQRVDHDGPHVCWVWCAFSRTPRSPVEAEGVLCGGCERRRRTPAGEHPGVRRQPQEQPLQPLLVGHLEVDVERAVGRRADGRPGSTRPPSGPAGARRRVTVGRLGSR